MSSLQKTFAKAKLAGLPLHPPLPPGAAGAEVLAEEAVEEDDDQVLSLPKRLSSGGATSDDSSSSASSADTTSSAGTIRPDQGRLLFARPRLSASDSRSNYAPVPWTAYFEQELHLADQASSMKHHVYLNPPLSSTAPLFVMHHGAGSSGLSFAACASEMRRLAPEIGILSVDARGHGETVILPKKGVYSPTSGAAVAEGTVRSYEEQRMARKEGEDKDGVLDLSLETLSTDLEKVVRLVQERMSWKELPNLVLVGHSLGGAVITNVAKRGRLGNKVLGYAVLDVVEGSAIDALQSMQTYLSTRPKTFPSIEAGVEWHIRSRTIRTSQSARISVPSLLRPTTSASPSSSPPHSPGSGPVTTFPNTHPNAFSTTPISPPSLTPAGSETDLPMLRGSDAPADCDSSHPTPAPPSTSTSAPSSTDPTSSPVPILNASSTSPATHDNSSIPLSTSSTSSNTSTSTPTSNPLPPTPGTSAHYTWRTDLRSTAPFWEDWFVGLSAKFLSARGGKLLLLAGTDRLDKELMIGQMQGKYQLQVYPDAGHFIQEDLPQKTAVALVDFYRRNDGSALVLPPKVGAILKKKNPADGSSLAAPSKGGEKLRKKNPAAAAGAGTGMGMVSQ